MVVCLCLQNCIRDITDALIALCEDRDENKETTVLSNSQIIHSVIDIFGAGEKISAILSLITRSAGNDIERFIFSLQ